MRILVIGHYPPHKGGVANHTDNLVKELRKRHEVYVLTYGPITPREFERELVYQVRVPPVFGLRGVLFVILAFLKILKLHKKLKFDLIHAHYVGTTSYAGVLAKKKLNIPLITTAHGSDLDFMSKLPLGRYFVRESLSKSDMIIAVSHYLKKRALDLGARKINVIPNGIRKLKPKKAVKRYITFIGALTYYKDPETFIRLAEHFPKEKFLIVGDGPLMGELKNKAPPNVKFLGYRTDIENVLAESKMLVVPSLREGFGLVIVEANLLGVPVVGRAVGGIKELIRDGKNGYFFKDFDELLEKVRLLLDNKKALKMGRTGRRISEKYAWEKITEKVEEVYREVLGEGHDNSNKHARCR
ncbi:glycosyltransferase family 4 protein [Thermococcus aggregans]|uniref:Glycosyltransferase family 4 protein n=1 Tax=Thermococcus aggregans TaxID=110163 RepID=A0A9E7MZ55_THEAG|nr:glycosyltransferase family 4 protein [Thermococcus aggregans]USS41432.1 glycosyltransferase family 4 protein [Thermococcus aggregans]